MEQKLPAGRNDKAFIKSNGKQKAFHKGSNLSCRFHIHQHYDTYKERCETVDIPVNHWAIPRPIWNAMEAAKDAEQRGQPTKKEMQQQLDFQKMMGPREFTRAGVLHAVAMLIATNNQVRCQYLHCVRKLMTNLQPLALADNVAFCNSLVAMRPKSTMDDLPTSYNVKVHVHNEFIRHIEQLKVDIEVSLEIHSLRKIESYLLLIWLGSPRKSLNNCRWMVSRHNKDGISGDDESLNSGEGQQVEVESQSSWIQGVIWRT